MNKMIIIVGPTASGKSDLAMILAKELNLEIINADAFQIYREINAGINKPTSQDLKEVKHHFINNKSINDEWNIKEFQKEINLLIENNPNKNYIICGGSNLYIDSIIKNYDLKEIDRNMEFGNMSTVQLWNKLNELDPEEAKKININNEKRIKQALRIILSLKQLKSEKDKKNKGCIFKYIIISVHVERNKLYEKINNRTIDMINMNWKGEVEDLIQDSNYKNNNALKAIGYNDVYEAIISNTNINVEKIQQKTRNYAKRQITWIRNKFNVDIIYDKEKNNLNEVIKKCKDFLNE
ncbi:tRNA (adenosine(37)-N6)-dimethylallyltransferase MiaA [Malacoplasma muris]|uniref:tRNA (adenosine(37)-N6)-dimethylallyltransferase MiaA n=1 Tax=Malacoplasma muris TaxID=2119 RepID=UPI00398E8DD7